MASETRSLYAITFTGVSVSAAHDFFQIDPVNNRNCVLHSVVITQSSEPSSEEEQLTVQIIRGHTVDGSGGSVATPVPLLSDDVAAVMDAQINNTTIASGGTPVILHSEAFNSRMGWYYLPTPEMRTVTKANAVLFVVRLLNAPSDAITFNGTMYIEER